MEFIYNDGGREAAGYKGTAGDCACRAISIAAGMSYQEAYDLINQFAKSERTGKRKKSVSSARSGVYQGTMRKIMDHLGWRWVPTMEIGSGCKVHLRSDELPKGKLIVRVAKHFVAVIDGVLYDTWDSQEDGNRCVYGYWAAPEKPKAKSVPKMVPMPGIEKLAELKAEYPRKAKTATIEFTKEELEQIMNSYRPEEITDAWYKVFEAWENIR